MNCKSVQEKVKRESTVKNYKWSFIRNAYHDNLFNMALAIFSLEMLSTEEIGVICTTSGSMDL